MQIAWTYNTVVKGVVYYVEEKTGHIWISGSDADR